MKILAFSGSLRDASFNQRLVRIAAEGAGAAGADVKVITLRDFPMPVYDEDIENKSGKPEEAKKLKELFLESDGFLIASPEYNSMITGALKNAIDWVSRADSDDEEPLSALRGRKAAIISASPGGYGGSRSLGFLRDFLGNMHVDVIPEQFSLPKAHEAFEEDGSLSNEENSRKTREVGEALAAALSKKEA